MKWAVQIIAIFLVTAGLCWAGGYEATGKAGPYTVSATFDRPRPVEGTNRVEIAVTDGASRRVPDARVDIEYFMPSLPGKSPMMDYHTPAKPSGHGYGAILNLTMKGLWKVTVSIVGSGSTEKMTFAFELK
jgi:hypothetical protein